MSASRFAHVTAASQRSSPTRSTMRDQAYHAAQVPSSRRWLCLRCDRKWRCAAPMACPHCYGPSKENV
jgi:rubrerythrin